MSFDEGLAERTRDALRQLDAGHATEKRMFGGIAFMLNGHMCCGIVDDRLMVRVGPDAYEDTLALAHASPMDFTGKPLRGFIYVNPAGTGEDRDLCDWVARGVAFANSLPPK